MLVVAVVVTTSVFSQKIYRKAQWSVNETITSGSSDITRVEGENKVVVVTNIGYESQEALLEQLKEDKKNGKVTGDKYKNQLNEYKNISVGGMLYLYIERENPEEANTQNFVVVLKDLEGNEIQKKQMRTQDGKMKKDGSGYKNDGTVFIKTEITSDFMVEVVEGDMIYKFKVIVPAS